jgi:hypothetical protein
MGQLLLLAMVCILYAETGQRRKQKWFSKNGPSERACSVGITEAV